MFFTRFCCRQVVRKFCLYVQQATDANKRDVLPKHNCLILSPANVWARDENVFQNDAKLVETIFKHTGKVMDSGPSIKGMFSDNLGGVFVAWFFVFDICKLFTIYPCAWMNDVN